MAIDILHSFYTKFIFIFLTTLILAKKAFREIFAVLFLKIMPTEVSDWRQGYYK